MIVVPTGERLRLVEQDHHAHLTGVLASRMPPGELDHAAFIAAARVHDNGWREADAAPKVDGEGRPHTFSSVPDDVYEQVWRRGIDRACDLDPLIGLLVALHGARFFGSRTSPGMRDLAAGTDRRTGELLRRLGYDGRGGSLPADVQQASDRIAFLDALSLVLCGTLPDEITATADGTAYTLRRSGSTVAVTPWPFTGGPADLAVPVRHVPDRAYPTDDQLREAVAAAPLKHVSVRIGRDPAREDAAGE